MSTPVSISIIYDNTSQREDLAADWGFACLVVAHGRRLLFDTGAKGDVLLANMKVLSINPAEIGEVLISHDHWDHTGGLEALLTVNPAMRVWAPTGCQSVPSGADVVYIDGPHDLSDGLYSTGVLSEIEHSLAIQTQKGVAVVVGCSHPGVGQILDAASTHGTPHALIGGLHGFDQFDRLSGLSMICPTHCTQHM
ncbi:MBL fold metallo-hydrolase, partial [candidate division GN15 bacterium]|nr:MBL fold metallo-hydrolase [candidate division GN15 bacterium]